MLLNTGMNFMETQTISFVERDQSRKQPAQLPASLSSLSLSESHGKGCFSLMFKCCPLPFLLHHQAQILFLFMKLYIGPFFSEVCSKGSAVFVSPGPNAVLQNLWSYSRPAEPESAFLTRFPGVFFRLHNGRNDVVDQFPHG